MMEAGPVVELESPLTRAALQPSLEPNGRLQISRALPAKDLALIEAFLAEHPQVFLRLYRAPKSRGTFDWQQLAALPSLKRLWIEANAGELNDLAPLECLPRQLEHLTLDTVAAGSDIKKDKPKQNMAVLERLSRLSELSLWGQLANLDFLAAHSMLKTLHLGRCKLASLKGIEQPTGLQHLKLFMTGTKDLSPLAALNALRTLELDGLRGVTSFASIMQLKSLQRLWLLAFSAEEPLPSFAALKQLKVLVIDKLITPDNLGQVAAAPSLRCLILPGCPAMAKVEALSALADHPALQEIRLESFNEKVWDAISARYGWKVDYCNYPADEYLQV